MKNSADVIVIPAWEMNCARNDFPTGTFGEDRVQPMIRLAQPTDACSVGFRFRPLQGWARVAESHSDRGPRD